MNRILAIDDNADNLVVLKAYLSQYMPSHQFIKALSGEEGLQKAITEQPEVIILDIQMPDMDGYEVCEKLKENEKTSHIPVLMLTAIHTDSQSKVKGLETGADSFLSKPINPNELISQVKVMLRIKKTEDQLRNEKKELDREVKDRTKALEQAQKASIQTIARILAMKDPHSSGQQDDVACLAKEIGKKLALPSFKLEGLNMATMICNIGKISIPSDILNKPGKLLPAEFELIKQHCQIGYDMIKDLPFPWPIADIILQHHENIDGSGYPQQLRDKDILLEARIIRVAETVIAMLSHRPYRPAYNLPETLQEIQQNRGQRYDADVADICLTLFGEEIYSLKK